MSVDNPKNELYDDFVKMVDKVSSAVIKETSQPIAEQIRIATAAMQKTSQVLQKTSTEFENKSGSIEGLIKVTSHTTAQQVESGVTQLKNDNSTLKTHVTQVTDAILKRIDNDLKVSLSQNFASISKDFEGLKEQNKTLQHQLTMFQQKQEKLLYWILGVSGFFSLSIITLSVFVLRGMK